MPTAITEKTLKDWISKGENLQSGDVACAEGIKYDFRLGTKFLKSHFGRMTDFTQLSNEEKRYAVVKPGEVVYVLTQERLNLAKDIFVQLSPKRKLSHAGILLLGGLTIDPGYKGNLIFGLCNLSSTEFTLDPGKKLVGAVFYKLSEAETIDYEIPEALDDFPEEVTTIIKQYIPVESLSLANEIKRISEEVSRITRTLESDNEWKNTFKQNLSSVSEKLNEISTALQVEITVRKQGEETLQKNDDKLNDAVECINKNISSFKIWARILAIILAPIVAIGVGLLTLYFSEFFTR